MTVAAYHLGSVKPELKSQIVVLSSVYETVSKVSELNVQYSLKSLLIIMRHFKKLGTNKL